MENKVLDLCFVGAGLATNFAVLKLIEQNYKGNILIIEKGKSLKNRPNTDVINGYFGAGAYSDFKLSSALDVGGVIPNLTSEELNKYGDYIINILNKYNESNPVEWGSSGYFDTKDSTLNFNIHKTAHVGTDRGRVICKNIENFIASQPNINILYETEVLDIDKNNDFYKIYLNDGSELQSLNVVLATGQKNTLPGKMIDKFNLNSTPRAFQLGVRVEDQMNPQYEEIIKANYDFKFVKNYEYDSGAKVRVRTFCCNSGNAHTCAEKASEGFTCFNGHAFKTSDPNNHTVNYGIMCEMEYPETYKGIKYNLKSNQIDLMKKINSLDCWESDNFDSDDKLKPTPKRKLLEGFDHLKGLYPDEIIESLLDFSKCLNTLVDLNKAHYLYPEVKLSGMQVKTNDKFETELSGLYMIGDCLNTRGIIKSSIEGIIFAENFIKE